MTEPEHRPLLTPTRLIAGLGVLVALLGAALLVKWWTLPPVVTIEVDQPAGETVICHFVVDGRPESRTDIVPAKYEFEARQIAFAVITEEESDENIGVSFNAPHSSAHGENPHGVRGEHGPGGSLIGGMNAHEAQTMRAAVMAEREKDDAP